MSGLVDEHGNQIPITIHSHPADELLKLRDALAKAYTAAYALNQPRQAVLQDLAAALKETPLDLIPGYLADLEAVVKARTLGNRCGDFISQEQLRLLKDAMAE